MKNLFLTILLFSSSIVFSQSETLPVIGVAKFTSEVESKFSGAVTQKIVQVLTQSRRFQVVDRTSYDHVKEELELQKSEAFLDSKNTAQQGVALAAEYLVTGNIIKMNIFAMKNPDGSTNGYKSSMSFQLNIQDVERGSNTKSESFQSNVSSIMHSPEGAVTESLKSLNVSLQDWVTKNFPINVKVLKIITIKKDEATSILIAGGNSYGLKVGDKLSVQKIEMLDGMPYPTEIGTIKITKLAGDNFAECSVSKGSDEILARFNANEKLNCSLLN